MKKVSVLVLVLVAAATSVDAQGAEVAPGMSVMPSMPPMPAGTCVSVSGFTGLRKTTQAQKFVENAVAIFDDIGTHLTAQETTCQGEMMIAMQIEQAASEQVEMYETRVAAAKATWSSRNTKATSWKSKQVAAQMKAAKAEQAVKDAMAADKKCMSQLRTSRATIMEEMRLIKKILGTVQMLRGVKDEASEADMEELMQQLEDLQEARPHKEIGGVVKFLNQLKDKLMAEMNASEKKCKAVAIALTDAQSAFADAQAEESMVSQKWMAARDATEEQEGVVSGLAGQLMLRQSLWSQLLTAVRALQTKLKSMHAMHVAERKALNSAREAVVAILSGRVSSTATVATALAKHPEQLKTIRSMMSEGMKFLNSEAKSSVAVMRKAKESMKTSMATSTQMAGKCTTATTRLDSMREAASSARGAAGSAARDCAAINKQVSAELALVKKLQTMLKNLVNVKDSEDADEIEEGLAALDIGREHVGHTDRIRALLASLRRKLEKQMEDCKADSTAAETKASNAQAMVDKMQPVTTKWCTKSSEAKAAWVAMKAEHKMFVQLWNCQASDRKAVLADLKALHTMFS